MTKTYKVDHVNEIRRTRSLKLQLSDDNKKSRKCRIHSYKHRFFEKFCEEDLQNTCPELQRESVGFVRSHHLTAVKSVGAAWERSSPIRPD